MWERARPAQQRANRKAPAVAELVREALRGVMPAEENALAVRRNERQHRDPRRRHHVGDELGGLGGKASEPALLPGGDEAPDAAVVLDLRPRGGERESATGALPAASHGPGCRRPAALAQRRSQQRQVLPAAFAELPPARSADDALGRQQ